MAQLNYTIHALHGFLGSPTDWKTLFTKTDPVMAHNIYAQDLAAPSQGLDAWAESFNARIASTTSQYTRPVLLGYSLGGRLALHCLAQRPDLWQAAIIVSAHPGMPEELKELRQQRWKNDLQWAARFKNDPWDALLEDWNRQPVFNHNHRFKRREEEYNREFLAQTMEGWSLAKQMDLRATIRTLPMPILWVTGELDLLYTQIAQSLIFKNLHSKVWVAKNARHRLPWQIKNAFRMRIFEFLEPVLDTIHYKESSHVSDAYTTVALS